MFEGREINYQHIQLQNDFFLSDRFTLKKYFVGYTQLTLINSLHSRLYTDMYDSEPHSPRQKIHSQLKLSL